MDFPPDVTTGADGGVSPDAGEGIRAAWDTGAGKGGRKGRVLAVRGGALGDFLLTLPSLERLERAGWEVSLLTRPDWGRLAAEFGRCREWRALDGAETAGLMVPGLELRPELREWLGRFEGAVSWVPDPGGTFRRQLREQGGIRHFVQGDWRCAGSRPAAVQLGGAAERFLEERGEGKAGAEAPEVRFFEKAVNRPRGGAGLVAVHPGSGSVRKNWPWERWMALMKAAAAAQARDGEGGRGWPQHAGKHGGSPSRWLVITGEAEGERAAGIWQDLDRSGLPWEKAHALRLPDLARRLAAADLFLGHDSGISHLAAACGVPCRLLFGPTDPAVWAPAGADIRTLRPPEQRLDALEAQTVIHWLGLTRPGKGIGAEG